MTGIIFGLKPEDFVDNKHSIPESTKDNPFATMKCKFCNKELGNKYVLSRKGSKITMLHEQCFEYLYFNDVITVHWAWTVDYENNEIILQVDDDD